MFIIKERYLEVPNFQNWTEGLYLVDAPCGTGKSYFVFHTLYPFAKENNKKLIVFSNRNALKRQQELQAEGTDIELITYQKLEYNQYLNGDWNVRRSVPDLMQELEGYDYIVLDEAHYLFQDARFNRNTEVILSMIERYRLSKVIIMLSATPDLLKSYFGDRIKETYEAEADYSYIQKAYCYTSKDAAYKILDSIPQNEKAVFFGDSRERLKELHRRYSDSAYLCSDNETTSDVFEQITSTERFACRFLFTTKVLDNGVNLTDRTIKHIIIEQTDLIDFIQCLGRKRVQDALTKGLQYANQLHMSKQAIYDQLTSSYGEGFPADAAQYAVDNMTGVDWNANALEKAKQYYYDMAMSKSAVYDQLTSSYGEQFTASQAQYAIDHLD